MTANPSLIDTMAQMLHEDRRARDGFFIPWSECHPSHHKATREDVLSVMRSLLEAGPTEAMLASPEVKHLGLSLDDEGILEYGSGIEAVYAVGKERAAELFASMLRAALEEPDNHG